MCQLCNDIRADIAYLQKELKELGCGKTILKHPERKSYWREYYQRNRDAKLAKANERNAEKRGYGKAEHLAS